MQRWRHYEQRGDLGFVNVIESRSQNSVISRLASLLGHRNTTRSFGVCLVLSILAWTKQLQDAFLFINLILRAVAQRQCSRFQRYSLKTRMSDSLERSPTNAHIPHFPPFDVRGTVPHPCFSRGVPALLQHARPHAQEKEKMVVYYASKSPFYQFFLAILMNTLRFAEDGWIEERSTFGIMSLGQDRICFMRTAKFLIQATRVGTVRIVHCTAYR